MAELRDYHVTAHHYTQFIHPLLKPGPSYKRTAERTRKKGADAFKALKGHSHRPPSPCPTPKASQCKTGVLTRHWTGLSPATVGSHHFYPCLHSGPPLATWETGTLWGRAVRELVSPPLMSTSTGSFRNKLKFNLGPNTYEQCALSQWASPLGFPLLQHADTLRAFGGSVRTDSL